MKNNAQRSATIRSTRSNTAEQVLQDALTGDRDHVAVSSSKHASPEDDVSELHNLAVRYHTGKIQDGRSQEGHDVEAVKLYKRGADANFLLSMINLAWMHAAGRVRDNHIPQEHKAIALELYQRASAGGMQLSEKENSAFQKLIGVPLQSSTNTKSIQTTSNSVKRPPLRNLGNMMLHGSPGELVPDPETISETIPNTLQKGLGKHSPSLHNTAKRVQSRSATANGSTHDVSTTRSGSPFKPR